MAVPKRWLDLVKRDDERDDDDWPHSNWYWSDVSLMRLAPSVQPRRRSLLDLLANGWYLLANESNQMGNIFRHLDFPLCTYDGNVLSRRPPDEEWSAPSSLSPSTFLTYSSRKWGLELSIDCVGDL